MITHRENLNLCILDLPKEKHTHRLLFVRSLTVCQPLKKEKKKKKPGKQKDFHSSLSLNFPLEEVIQRCRPEIRKGVYFMGMRSTDFLPQYNQGRNLWNNRLSNPSLGWTGAGSPSTAQASSAQAQFKGDLCDAEPRRWERSFPLAVYTLRGAQLRSFPLGKHLLGPCAP